MALLLIKLDTFSNQYFHLTRLRVRRQNQIARRQDENCQTYRFRTSVDMFDTLDSMDYSSACQSFAYMSSDRFSTKDFVHQRWSVARYLQSRFQHKTLSLTNHRERFLLLFSIF